VTAGDAANLLIAIAGSPHSGPTVKQTLTTWKQYSDLALTSRPRGPDYDPRLDSLPLSELRKKLPAFAHLKRNHRFGEALVALILAAGNGEFDTGNMVILVGHRSG
jgi:hypothetical protein